MMTKKDFAIIATALWKARPDENDAVAFVQWRVTCTNMALTLRDVNPRFDAKKFYQACGYSQ